MAVCFARMVMPRSRSWSIESMTRSTTSWFSRHTPDCWSMASTSVVLPWSTWAMIATFRTSSRLAFLSLIATGYLCKAGVPRGGRKVGDEAASPRDDDALARASRPGRRGGEAQGPPRDVPPHRRDLPALPGSTRAARGDDRDHRGARRGQPAADQGGLRQGPVRAEQDLLRRPVPQPAPAVPPGGPGAGDPRRDEPHRGRPDLPFELPGAAADARPA